MHESSSLTDDSILGVLIANSLGPLPTRRADHRLIQLRGLTLLAFLKICGHGKPKCQNCQSWHLNVSLCAYHVPDSHINCVSGLEVACTKAHPR